MRTKTRGTLTLWLVQFPDQPSWVPEDQLEPEPAEGPIRSSCLLRVSSPALWPCAGYSRMCA